MHMAYVYPNTFFKDRIVASSDAVLPVTSSAVLYGLSVYTVFPVLRYGGNTYAFRLPAHYERLIRSAQIIGIDTFAAEWPYARFLKAVQDVVGANTPTARVFVRATVHVDALVAGTRSRGLSSCVSLFMYEASAIIPQTGARLKTSVWRRVPDYAIPSRAKVNGAYVNSVLGKQDAIDSGYDDCIFLDIHGHVCELSAANIFMVRDGVLYTPSREQDILEGINRDTLIMLAKSLDIPVVERAIDLTELYIADEVFACGTSAFVAPVIQIDARKIGKDGDAPITTRLKERYDALMTGGDMLSGELCTRIT